MGQFVRQHGVLFGAAEFGGEIHGQTDAGPENAKGNRAGQAGGLEQADFSAEGQALEDGVGRGRANRCG